MDYIVFAFSEKPKHCPQMLQWVMNLVGNLDAVDSRLNEAFQYLWIRFVLVQQIKMNVMHT